MITLRGGSIISPIFTDEHMETCPKVTLLVNCRAGTELVPYTTRLKCPKTGKLSQELGMKWCHLLSEHLVRRLSLTTQNHRESHKSHHWWNETVLSPELKNIATDLFFEVRDHWLAPLLSSHNSRYFCLCLSSFCLIFWILPLFSVEKGILPQLGETEKQQGRDCILIWPYYLRNLWSSRNLTTFRIYVKGPSNIL